jgi:uncharacterized RDD family membrane protein YckC
MSGIPTIPHQSVSQSLCPLCNKRPVGSKAIYFHPVCRKCFYGFVNRRQGAYLLDGLIYLIPAFSLSYMITYEVRVLMAQPLTLVQQSVLNLLIGIPLNVLFLMKDGFGGYSPGKRLTGVQVVDKTTGQPIGFGQSLKRNAVLAIGLIPLLGGLIVLIIEIVINFQLGRGYRIGDPYAHTRVIWAKYARLSVFGGTALVCESCGYDLQGNISGVCPECGTKVSSRNAARLAVPVQP